MCQRMATYLLYKRVRNNSRSTEILSNLASFFPGIYVSLSLFQNLYFPRFRTWEKYGWLYPYRTNWSTHYKTTMSKSIICMYRYEVKICLPQWITESVPDVVYNRLVDRIPFNHIERQYSDHHQIIILRHISSCKISNHYTQFRKFDKVIIPPDPICIQ